MARVPRWDELLSVHYNLSEGGGGAIVVLGSTWTSSWLRPLEDGRGYALEGIERLEELDSWKGSLYSRCFAVAHGATGGSVGEVQFEMDAELWKLVPARKKWGTHQT